jgi:curved DNA-binding protein CbpA
MDLREIQHAIETLSNEQQIALLDWLTERDRRQWDSQIERDFSPDGAGMELLNQVKAQIRRGESVRMGNGR